MSVVISNTCSIFFASVRFYYTLLSIIIPYLSKYHKEKQLSQAKNKSKVIPQVIFSNGYRI